MLNLIDLEGGDTSGLPIFVEFRCILFWDTSESDVLGTSRCIWNVWFLEHTSEMPNLGAFPMYCYSSFNRRYIGIEISMPIPMYGSPNLSKRYIGMGQYRLFPMYRPKLPKQNTSEFQVFTQSRCISINFPRVYLFAFAAYSRASRLQFNFPRKQASL